MKHVTAIAAALVCAVAYSAAVQPDKSGQTTVIVVRHAEKEKDGKGDLSPLSKPGRDRADELARLLTDVDVKAVYVVKDVPRTEETARPTVKRLADKGITIKPQAVGDGGKDVAADILRNHRGEIVLVVSRTFLVDKVLTGLGVKHTPGILPEEQYDDLFVCSVPAQGEPVLRSLRYGKRPDSPTGPRGQNSMAPKRPM